MGVRLTDRLPPWLHEWLDIVVPGGQILLILLAAWLLRLLGRRLLDRLGRRYTLPPEAVMGARRVMTFLIYAAALLLALERMGVSGTVLWTAFTGFAAVGAVAFFAAWSVLSNIFCTMLILTTRPFRLYDHVELLENGEKPGLRGQVVDINLVYTTLRETDDGDGAGTVLQVPNSLFFQRALRRWRGGALPEPRGVGAKRGDPLDV
ncbi:mechanosensitive ion channel family protein [Luteimonas sp. S4-F44]|uniref:mechanosensitive ion channel family protein n=1 Tax=Luteimonas sp. S4-F44 TaxID=2925842 RepID=UPI001F53DBF5|nr:mechanosensitive ion channel family protein [Luteimonas sp. S4-F44]UNK43874.1 mechanosensitive ion channel family protein [Luteimonas sp. S4-F44]